MSDPLPKPELPITGSMPFLDHLEELRRRLLKSLLSVVATTGAAFYFAHDIMRFIVAPLGDTRLHVTQVTGSFYAFLVVSLIAGLVVSSPIVFYQLWSFVGPGLYPREKARVLPLMLVSTLLFLAGAAFCYLIVLPFSLKFLIGFSGDLFSPIITVGSYLTFAGTMMLAFGLGFELPVAAYFLGRIGIVSSRVMSRGRRYAVVLILIAAAILTPTPDVATQFMLAGPLYFLYEVSIIVVKLTGARK
ncbi:MAG TPA: twin-arginine translocase subunit TatC [Candidatus Deferrimicrobium sp.]|nr:twin-arginine translocase subunit TatC [Candidatus Deferrimicrobium sp.]